MLTMYDSIDISSMPSDGDVYAGYVDGEWPTFSQLPAAFPGKQYVSITVFGKDNNGNFVDAIVCDREDGDMDPADAAAWAKWKISIGHRPTIYCNLAAHPDVMTALAAVGLAFVTDVDWWEADYDNVPELTPGSVAKQYQSTTDPDLDTSVVDPSWIGQPAPTPPAPPTPTEDPMVGVSAAVVTPDGYQHRAAIVYPGALLHIWIDGSGSAQHENVAAKADPSGGPVSTLTFDGNQVPTCQILGSQLVLGAQTVLGGTCFEFVQTIGTSGWGCLQLV